MIIGSHVSPQDPLGEAEARQADAVQIFMSNPQQWKAPIPREDTLGLAIELKQVLLREGIASIEANPIVKIVYLSRDQPC